MIHDLSRFGLLIETLVDLARGEVIQLHIPEDGVADARVVWSKGRFHGCQFTRPISAASLSAALLRSAVREGDTVQVTHEPTVETDISLRLAEPEHSRPLKPRTKILIAVGLSLLLWGLFGSALALLM